jgi:hypothetical protein
LDFQDSSWIIDHHRHNIITKICRPVNSWFRLLRAQRFESNQDTYHNSGCFGQEVVTDEQQLGPSNALPQCAINTTNSQLEGNSESYKINLSELQRLRLRQLQHKLVHHAIDLRYDAMEPSGWADDLREYGESDIGLNWLYYNVFPLTQLCRSSGLARLRLYGKIYITGTRPLSCNWGTSDRSFIAPSSYEKQGE